MRFLRVFAWVPAIGCLLLGLTTGNRLWFYPALMLIGVAAIGRVLAWLLHGAALAPDLIGVEALLAAMTYLLAREDPGDEKVDAS